MCSTSNWPINCTISVSPDRRRSILRVMAQDL
jgi:hypothetical protein